MKTPLCSAWSLKFENHNSLKNETKVEPLALR